MPQVSTIIPIHNAELYLRECLDSIVKQTLQDIEIICVDDGSADTSASILAEYAAGDNRIHILYNVTPEGAGASRNRGLAVAQGQYVHFMDADDYLAPDAYEILYRAALANNLDMVKAKAFELDTRTMEIRESPLLSLADLKKRKFGVVTNFYKIPAQFARLIAVPWNGLYRRVFLQEHTILFNTLVCVNDRSFYNHVIIHARRAMILDYFMIYYRTNVPGSLITRRLENYSCHFESIRIILRQCAGLSSRLLFYVLENEFQDMFAWSRVSRQENHLFNEIQAALRAFLHEFDMSILGWRLYCSSFYADYIRLCYPAFAKSLAGVLCLTGNRLVYYGRYTAMLGFIPACRRAVNILRKKNI